ncbi:MAG: rhomboid family intramembrane serine protease [Acidobacteriota bacterium]|nr:rhomboid family intramembrane serine protease [Acidobacteriota bacterium]
MFGRQTSGSAVCPSCGKLVGINEARCWNCGRANPGMWGFGRVLRRFGENFGSTDIILWGCGTLYVISLLLDLSGIRFDNLLAFLAPSGRSLLALGASGALPVLGDGAWWTLLSAGWLHGGLLHILFNMLWVRQLGPVTTALYGPGRMLLIYLVSSAAGFAASAFGGVFLSWLAFIMGGHPYSISVGASAAVFGLLGAMVYAERRGVVSHLGRQAWGYAIALFVFGLVLPGVDNWAHLGGFLGGYGLGKLLDPARPERPDHLLMAVALLVMTAVAIIASFARVAL